MTRKEFENLQSRYAGSGQTLKVFLRSEGISYSTYNYWRKKCDSDSDALPMAPIRITEPINESAVTTEREISTDLPGVTLAFPNGLRTHFGRGGEKVLMEVLTQSLSGHVLP